MTSDTNYSKETKHVHTVTTRIFNLFFVGSSRTIESTMIPLFFVWWVHVLAVNCNSIDNVETISTVDLSENEETIARKIYQAATTIGFFYLIGHNVTAELQNQVFVESRNFFNLNTEDKLQYKAKRNQFYGYTGMEEETLDFDANVSLTRPRGDTKEGFNIYKDMDDASFYNPDTLQLRTNWPNATKYPSISNFRATMRQYYDEMDKLGRKLNEYLALSLNLNKTFFSDNGCFDNNALRILRLLHYSNEKSDISNGIYGCGEHSDYGAITFLLIKKNSQGLQIFDEHNSNPPKWIDVNLLSHLNDNAYIVNIGDSLQRWTNDVYLSTKHRVITSKNDRYSIAYFWEPSFNCQIECLPSICHSNNTKINTAKYESISHGQHLINKFSATYKYFQQNNVNHDQLDSSNKLEL